MNWLRLTALMAVSLLVSCIDGREEIWIHRDGSGRAEVNYTLPASAAVFQGGEAGVRHMLEEFLSKSTALTTSSVEVKTVGDRLHIRVLASFAAAMDLKKIAEGPGMHELPSSATGLAGTVTVALRGLSLDFTRSLTPGTSLPGAALLPASAFQDRSLTYIIHLPLAATESNATRKLDGGRTLIWEFPLAEAVKKPITTHFIAPIPFPKWIWLLGIGLLLLLGLILHGWKRRRIAKHLIE
jgi:hypothetical protein